MRESFALLFLIFATNATLAGPSVEGNQTKVGPWSVAKDSKTAKFESCTMSRNAGEFTVTFVRDQHGLSMLLDSPKWNLDRGKSYPVRLLAGSRSVEAKAFAERKSVTIALEDSGLKSNLRRVNALQVRGEGATLGVPLDDSAEAFDRLETCFGNRVATESNPFVAPVVQTNPFAAKRNPFVSQTRKHKKLAHRPVQNYSLPFPIFSAAHTQ
jgi:hypothetical protein